MRFALCALVLLLLPLGASAGPAASHTCSDVAEASQAGRFDLRLKDACLEAVPALTRKDEVISAWLAYRFLQDLKAFQAAVATIGHRPSDAGAYLIAQTVGLTLSLEAWETRRGL